MRYFPVKQRQHKKSLLLLVVIILVVAAGLAWLLGRGKQEIRHVLLISLDTTRADYLSCYGFEKPTTPHIDAIANEGILFEHAVTPVALTLPAHVSVFTSTYPPYHQVHDNLSLRITQTHITLAEALNYHGFATTAVIGSVVLDRKYWLDQGFETYHDQFERAGGEDANVPIERIGGETSRHVREYLGQYGDKPFFMFAHFYDPHTPYEPPEPFASQHADDPYAGEIAYVDQCVGEIIKELKDLDLYDSTLIVVMGDHGEGLGEHGEAEHGYYVYQNTIHVPLIIRAPGERGGQRISNLVSLVDIMPTILSYLDIPIPHPVQGRDLSGLPAADSDSEQDHYIYTESMLATRFGGNPLLGLVGNRWKYIETNRPELYDLKKDPGESNNLIQADAQMAQHMRETLAALAARLLGVGSPDQELALDAENIRRLESLGYVAGEDLEVSFAIDHNKTDPKDLIAYNEAYKKVVFLLYYNEYEEADRICRTMLQDFPNLINTHHLLGRSSFAQKNWQQCIDHFRTYIELATSQEGRDRGSRVLDPNKPLLSAYEMTGDSYFALARYAEAAQYYRSMLAINAKAPDVHNRLAAALFKLEEFEEAVQHWRKSLTLKPDDPETHLKIGAGLFKLGKSDETERHWREALRLKPDSKEIQYKLDHLERLKKTVAEKRAREDAAVAKLLAELERDPNNAENHDAMAGTCYSLKKMSLAVKHWNEYLRLKPDDYMVMNNLAWLLAIAADDEIRQPQEALRLATRAAELTNSQQPGILDTLAAARAAAGDFDQAVAIAEKAIELAQAGGNFEQAARIRGRLQLYQEQKPYIDKE